MKLSSKIHWIAATTLGLTLAEFGLHFAGGGGSDWSPVAAVAGAVFATTGFPIRGASLESSSGR